jgi:hypothetical protein
MNFQRLSASHGRFLALQPFSSESIGTTAAFCIEHRETPGGRPPGCAAYDRQFLIE